MWGVTVECSAMLQATAREACAESLALRIHAHDVRGDRPVCGGSDLQRPGLATLVVSVILQRPTCLNCIAEKVGAPALAVVRAIESIGETVNVRITNPNNERCRMCGSTLGPTYSLPR
jgi:hypothetical protein